MTHRKIRNRLVLAYLVALLTLTPTMLTESQQASASEQAVAAAILCSEVSHTPGNYIVEIESSGQTRQFRLHIPPGYQAGSPVPLVINLHGFAMSGHLQEVMSGMSDKADEAGFIVVHPEGRGTPRRWYVGPTSGGQQEDMQFMRDLINCLESRLSIAADRIYATGFSNGGGMAHRLGCDLADVIAAIGPVSGAYLFHDACQPGRPVPVIAFHGTEDGIVPYYGGMGLPPIPDWAAAWAARNGCAPTPTLTYSQGDVTGETWGNCIDDATVTLYTIAGGKHIWPGIIGTTPFINATDTIWEFFVAHPLRRHEIYLPLVLRNY